MIVEKKSEKRGIECPRCGCRHFRVLYLSACGHAQAGTRRAWGGRILRRRECRHCGRRVTTQEKATE